METPDCSFWRAADARNFTHHHTARNHTHRCIWRSCTHHCADSHINCYGLLGASGCGKTTILNCIVGKNKVDDGEIWILGEKCVGIAGSKVGYMPQDLALINEFTVKDSIYFFGRIFAMDTESLREKYEELTTLLNLPKDGRLVGDCSGGEKRRLSFAIALVHNPELLILDEPSVGVDPILRERIWNYLTETCSNNKTSILITTHYIEESRQANRIGFLREGKLLVESSPTSLLSKFNVPTLEEVFLICSRNQEEQIENANSHEIDHLDNIGTASPMEEFEMDCDSTKNHANESPKKINNSSFSWHRFGALMEKNWKRIRRNKLIVGVQVMVPSIQILLFFFAIGRDVHNIPLGIVNDEATATYCENFPLNKTVVATGDWECEMDHISCRLLHHLDNPVIKKDYYGSIPEAMDDLKSGRIVGVMHMNRNLSSLVQKRVVEGIELGENGEILQNEVQVWMDMTNLNIGSSLKKKIYNLYEEFHASVYSECEFNPKTVEIPMRVEEYVYGTKDDEFIIFMVPGLIMMGLYSIGVMITCVIVIDEKCEGIWDRSIIAGVTAFELAVSHFIVQAILMMIMTIEMLFSVFFVARVENIGNLWLVFFMMYIQGISGIITGFFISTLSKDHSAANSIVFGVFNSQMIICGTFWPIESMHEYIRVLARTLPLTVPIECLRSIVKKGWGLSNPQIQGGIGIMILWILIPAILSIYVMKVKR